MRLTNGLNKAITYLLTYLLVKHHRSIRAVAYSGYHKGEGQIFAGQWCLHEEEGQAMFFLFFRMVKNKTKIQKGAYPIWPRGKYATEFQ